MNINLQQRVYLITELENQKTLKTKKVESLTRDVVVLSATINHLTTPDLVRTDLYLFRHLQYNRHSTDTKIPRGILGIAGDDIALIQGSPIAGIQQPVEAVAIAQPVVTDPLGKIQVDPSDEEGEVNPSGIPKSWRND
mmetsp:Transcript_21887/g.31390  ORF Transcript_21887/g.31390 Transcript_21887/m.31390 type:complete len:138 (-) Transcript_21887:3134-3547(-)